MKNARPTRWPPFLLGLGALALACAPRAPLGPAPEPAEARLVLDTRAPEEFAAGHIPGALNLQWAHEQLKERVASYVPDRSTPLALRAASTAEAERAAALLQRLGYRDVTLPAAVAEDATLALIDARALRAELAGSQPPLVIDVRTREEWARGTIPGALLVDENVAAELAPERGRRIAVICESGYRSSQLASLLLRQGYADVVNVIDGMAGWRALE